jgi:tetratricopeptide (TPR) repeat protein
MKIRLSLLSLFLALSWPLSGQSQPADLQQFGRAYIAEGDSAAAIKSYGELVRQNPFDPVALNNMAIAKASAGDYQAALELLNRANRLAPQRVDIRENLKQLQTWLQKNHSVSLNTETKFARNTNNVRNPGNPGSTVTVLPEPPALWSAIAAPVRTK